MPELTCERFAPLRLSPCPVCDSINIEYYCALAFCECGHQWAAPALRRAAIATARRPRPRWRIWATRLALIVESIFENSKPVMRATHRF